MDTATEAFVLNNTPDNVTEDLLAKSPNIVEEETNCHHRSACNRRCLTIAKCAQKNLLVLLTLLGAVVGIAAGVTLRRSGLNSHQISYIHFPGELFLRMMKMFIIPITISSLVTSSARIDTRTSGRIGLRIGVFFVLTLVIVALTGTILSLLIRPGANQHINDEEGQSEATVTSNPVLALMDLLRNMFAENLVEACLAKARTVIVSNGESVNHFQNLNSAINMTENVTGGEVEEYLTTNAPGVNMIGLIVASLTCGRAISHVGENALPLLNLAEAVFLVSLRIVGLFLWFTPIGVFSLVAANLTGLDAPGEAFKNLWLFLVTFYSGALIHSLIVLPLLYYITTRRNPYRFLFRLSAALMTAFVTDSSAATIPILIKCLENNNIDSRVSRQVASLGATVNKNGGTLFFPIIAIFVAQTNGIVLNVGQIITVNLVTISMVAGHAPTSGGGIVYIILLLTAVGLPTDGIALILAVDWLLERCRTTINVLANGFVAGMVDHFSRRDLQSEEPVHTNRISINIDNAPSPKDTVVQNSVYKRRTSI